MYELGVQLDQPQMLAVFKVFDRDGSGGVDYNEFMNTIRGDLAPSRLTVIRRAYEKMDVNKDGQVTLDDVAKFYDITQNIDV